MCEQDGGLVEPRPRLWDSEGPSQPTPLSANLACSSGELGSGIRVLSSAP